jgi:hypothetical protein
VQLIQPQALSEIHHLEKKDQTPYNAYREKTTHTTPRNPSSNTHDQVSTKSGLEEMHHVQNHSAKHVYEKISVEPITVGP